jgi:hypothetical protein
LDILSGEDIADIKCFLVGLVTGDNWQYDHGDNNHKKMTGDNWQIDHGENSHKRMTGDIWKSNHGDDSQCWKTGSSCADEVEDWDQRQTCLFMR